MKTVDCNILAIGWQMKTLALHVRLSLLVFLFLSLFNRGLHLITPPGFWIRIFEFSLVIVIYLNNFCLRGLIYGQGSNFKASML
jgi:hypothetical protein